MKIVLQKLHKSYKDADRTLNVIDCLTYEFPAQGTVAIVGRSGTGKSTLLHLLGGLDSPTSGWVEYDGSNFSALSVDERAAFRARKVGFVFQFHHLLPEFTAEENVAMPLIIAGDDEKGAIERAGALLTRVGLAERRGHRPSQLSGGEQQRVAIARSLIADPHLILADEPTGNLDIQTAAAVQGLLIDAGRQKDRLVVIVTHNLELAASMDIVLEMTVGGSILPYGGSTLHDIRM